MVGVSGLWDGRGSFLGSEPVVDGAGVYLRRVLSFSGIKFIWPQRII